MFAPQIFLSKALAPHGEAIEVVNVEQLSSGKGRATWLRDMNVVLVNDVITTARTCLEAHTKATMMGARVMCWAAIIDRTFGPGPVPVVAGITGEPVRLLEELP
jgi:orotate phosphoribosyltransferase